MSLPVQHLSDEAIAAFADAALSGVARHRAARHVQGCAECRRAVDVQHEAAWMLRSSTVPGLPTSLLDRLREVPTTTSVRAAPSVLDPTGAEVFPAYGTALTSTPASITEPPAENPARTRRAMNFGLFGAAAAVVTFGALAASAASVADGAAGGVSTGARPSGGSAVSTGTPAVPVSGQLAAQLAPAALVRPAFGP